MELNKIYNEDCFDTFKNIPDKSIDLVLTDPPYGITACKRDIAPDLDRLWVELKRIGKDNCAFILTSSQPFTSILILSNPKMFKYCWYWDKIKPKNHLNVKKQPMRRIEPICVFCNQISTYNPILTLKDKRFERDNGRTYKFKNSGVYGKDKRTTLNEGRTIPINLRYPDDLLIMNGVGSFGNEKTGHPNQKPVALFEYLIKTYTNKGDTILDPFAGSGTTGVACQNLNRNYILIEKDPKYYDIILKRLE